jgi:hypothetical protein
MSASSERSNLPGAGGAYLSSVANKMVISVTRPPVRIKVLRSGCLWFVRLVQLQDCDDYGNASIASGESEVLSTTTGVGAGNSGSAAGAARAVVDKAGIGVEFALGGATADA